VPALLLVRHGQASFGTEDYDVLSGTGHRQAAVARAALAARGVRPGRVLCGSLRRQRDTAAAWPDAELVTDARWDEYDSADVLRAYAASLEAPGVGGSRDFQRVLDEGLAGWIAGGAADEPWTAFRDRVAAALDDALAGLGRGETGVVITSGGPIAACAVRALGLPEPAFVAFNRVVVNAAVTKLVAGRGGLSLVAFNEHAHLEPDRLVTYR